MRIERSTTKDAIPVEFHKPVLDDISDLADAIAWLRDRQIGVNVRLDNKIVEHTPESFIVDAVNTKLGVLANRQATGPATDTWYNRAETRLRTLTDSRTSPHSDPKLANYAEALGITVPELISEVTARVRARFGL